MQQNRSVILFALAALTPVPLLGAGALYGGLWVWAGLAYITVFAFALDELVGYVAPNAPPAAEFPAANSLSATLALCHFAALGLALAAVSGATGLDPLHRIGAFVGFALFFGQISNANAHELIHRGDKRLFWLGKSVYISLLFGHHTSAHPLVHHRYVATPQDPNSAPLGLSFYGFVPRAWLGSFRAALRAENQRQAKRPAWRHPYLHYVGGAALCLILAWTTFGMAGLLSYLALASYATAQLLLSDYVQHYGLRRAQRPNGRYEPVGPQHSWDSPHWFSSLMMMNAPRHSDHHAKPNRAYPKLQLHDSPTLPHSLPAMAVLALLPPLWRRLMDHRAARWQG